MRSLCFTFFALFFYLRAISQNDTLHVYFDTDIPTPNKRSLNFLLRNIDSIKNGSSFFIIGYADERGDVYYNDMLSMRRSQNVAGFLETNGIDKKNIRLISGKGEVDRNNNMSDLYDIDRRVDLVILNSKKAERPVENDSSGMPGLEEQLMSSPVGRSVILNNVQFYLSSTQPTTSSYSTMKDLLDAMKNNSSLYIQLEGHICCIDPTDVSMRKGAYALSLGRSETLRIFLVKNGIDESRIRVMGFGRDRPLVPIELNEFDRLKNRRVEVRVIKK